MRLIAMAFASATALVVMALPASAAWVEHKYEDLGIVKEFPGEPKRETVEYKTPVAGTAQATRLSMSADNIDYVLTVVPLKDKLEASASIMGECVFMAEDEGEPLANMTTRIEPGAKAVYGRLVSVDLADKKGRRQTACLFTKGNLYIVQATVRPEHGQMNAPQAIRFTNSMSFNMEGEH